MTHSETLSLLRMMQVNWPHASLFKAPQTTLDSAIVLWFICLADLSFDTVKAAFIKACKNCKYMPSIAEFLELAKEVSEEVHIKSEDAFRTLRMGFQHMEFKGTSPEDFFNSLPPRTQTALTTMGGLDVFAPPNGTTFNYTAFLRTYEALCLTELSCMSYFPIS